MKLECGAKLPFRLGIIALQVSDFASQTGIHGFLSVIDIDGLIQLDANHVKFATPNEVAKRGFV